ncbi:hypothetical protein H2J98_02725 [Corynebacterium glutamicum]|uniref:Uncharacterized protein n=1 Tax=Corynebacterium glutamicum (strain ATCC 13032 / DSM 20300 / JCM 1318 / BCRC 11384 / CCUG 27702 / LMG 3730 / NBRC 12168 / NCIMB 10025 / NRRL B-2784 / 534) TaxID=196627 RepID=Q8NM17_CORGL|nr:hypothetical protein [Corynebacterium glutamicum]BAC00159.1 Hypothetical protein [Corynebacterium glutamicum ATCC 13032]ARV66034.1 hypothetical protein B7P23_14665 [Corynebacterium glutamicum]AUI02968.1 hypothetical protein C0I99_02005 [Corynebacterium glutamicum]MBA4569479.1 hypothetical protein [Corynebacterium glutamicum]MBA4578641.1 hypothetical protein [Corynebacterium glutamicum]
MRLITSQPRPARPIGQPGIFGNHVHRNLINLSIVDFPIKPEPLMDLPKEKLPDCWNLISQADFRGVEKLTDVYQY